MADKVKVRLLRSLLTGAVDAVVEYPKAEADRLEARGVVSYDLDVPKRKPSIQGLEAPARVEPPEGSTVISQSKAQRPSKNKAQSAPANKSEG